MLVSKLRSGTSKTKAGPLVRVALFWKSHYTTCSPECGFVPCDQIVQKAHLYMCSANVVFVIIVLFILHAIYILSFFHFFFIPSRVFYSHFNNYKTGNHMAMILCHFGCQEEQLSAACLVVADALRL